MHPSQIKFCQRIAKELPSFFNRKRVLDVGALNINGSNKSLFRDCQYYGLDVVGGNNVDIISIAHEYNDPFGFDVVISTNALEHDMYYEQTLKNMYVLLKPSGLMLVSVSHSHGEHGTRSKNPTASGTSAIEGWCDYYKNLTEDDFRTALDMGGFSQYILEVVKPDLQFWGIKK